MRYVLLSALFVLSGFSLGCSKGELNENSTVMEESRITEANHRKLVKAVPPPLFEHSLEREILVKRLKTLNVQNKIMYIYCLGLNGNVVYYGMVQGKVCSLNSLLTTPEQIIWVKTGNSGGNIQKMPSPDFDGSYGRNPDGIFWFDPSGGYHEWSGTFYLSDRPEKINTPVSITAAVDMEKKGN